MKRRLLAVIAAVLTVGFGLSVQPQRALADPTTCSGLVTGIVNGGLSVPVGNSCVLDGATVHGGVSVTGGTLFSVSSTIDGGLSLDGATGVNEVCTTHINGGLLVENVPAGSAAVIGEVDTGTCFGDTINGGAQFLNNPGVVELDSYAIDGTVTFTNNTAALQEVESNTINGSLDCTGNTGITDDGLPNTTTGPKTGQCATF